MFAVVEIQGKQYKVSPKETIVVDHLPQEKGAKVSFDKVFLVSDDKTTQVGSPVIDGHKVEAKVVDHFRDEKVIVFKKKRRKGYKVKKGHRQGYTSLEILRVK